MKNVTTISRLRKTRGWTQEYLSEKSGVSIWTIQRLESGDDTSLDTLRLVANALNVSVNDLFEHIDKEKEKDIDNLSEQQIIQINQRSAENNKFRIAKLLFYIFMILLAYFIDKVPSYNQNFIAVIWVALLLLGIYTIRYIRSFWWNNKLDIKYPLTKMLPRHKVKSYYSNSYIRTTMIIVWSILVPLLFILKFALKLF